MVRMICKTNSLKCLTIIDGPAFHNYTQFGLLNVASVVTKAFEVDISSDLPEMYNIHATITIDIYPNKSYYHSH